MELIYFHFFVSSEMPFSRWDCERVCLWLNDLGLNMYLMDCRRWVKNGEQLLRATQHEIEKVKLPNMMIVKMFKVNLNKGPLPSIQEELDGGLFKFSSFCINHLK